MRRVRRRIGEHSVVGSSHLTLRNGSPSTKSKLTPAAIDRGCRITPITTRFQVYRPTARCGLPCRRLIGNTSTREPSTASRAGSEIAGDDHRHHQHADAAIGE